MQRLLLALSLTSVFSQEVSDGVTLVSYAPVQAVNDSVVVVVGDQVGDQVTTVTAAPDPTVTAVTDAPVAPVILDVAVLQSYACANCGTACQDATAWINAGCCTGC